MEYPMSPLPAAQHGALAIAATASRRIASIRPFCRNEVL